MAMIQADQKLISDGWIQIEQKFLSDLIRERDTALKLVEVMLRLLDGKKGRRPK